MTGVFLKPQKIPWLRVFVEGVVIVWVGVTVDSEFALGLPLELL